MRITEAVFLSKIITYLTHQLHQNTVQYSSLNRNDNETNTTLLADFRKRLN